MITANHTLPLHVWSLAERRRFPKAREQLRQLRQQLRLSQWPQWTHLCFWRQRPQNATMSGAPRPPSPAFVRWGTTACNDPQFQVAPPPAPSPAQRPLRPSRVLRTIQVIAHGERNQPLVHLRLSGRLADVCDELDRLAALEGQA